MNEITIPYNQYSQGKIYQIFCHVTGKRYIGSTIIDLNKRLSNHKSKYRSYLKGLTNYVTVFEVLKNNHCDIVLLEEYPCSNSEELLIREGKWIKENDCVNINQPGKTKEEKEREYAMIQSNYKKSERGIETNRKYEKSEKAKETKKKYRQTESYKTYRKNYVKQKVKCVCNSIIRRVGYSKHLDSLKHKKWIEDNPESEEGFEFV
jgi:hypothetical protein